MAGLFDERSGGLVTYWKTISAITDIVGSGSSARIYPLLAKQSVGNSARIVYERAGGESVNRLSGTSGTRYTVLHVYCYGATLSASDALAEAVRANTANYRGTLSGVYVNQIECTDALDDGIDESVDKSDTHRYWTRLILRITHDESLGL